MPIGSIRLSIEAEKLKEDIKQNKEFKNQEIELVSKILETRLASLNLELEQQKNLGEDLKLYEAKIECLESKAKYYKHQKKSDKLDKKLEKIRSTIRNVEKKMDDARKKLDLYYSLDPNLMIEYRQLKDDLECQEMLFKLSEDNEPLNS